MASYLSYFTSNSSSAPTQQQYNQAQPGTSTWAGTFSSRLATLRKALTKDSEDDDPDNEDCSHVSNVLRAYYTQKGRAFPEWLPPDPKKPIAPPTPQGQYGQYGNMYGGQYTAPTHGRGNSGGRGGLSDLWDSGPAQQPANAPQSLRMPRPTPQSLRSAEPAPRPTSGDAYSTQTSQQTLSARPLPSQRAGSFQNNPAAGAAPVGSKADRLRARLQGGSSGRSSPASAQGSQNSFPDPGSYTRASAESGPPSSATEPWSNQSNQYGYDNYGGTGGYGNTAYRPRPGGPR